MSRRHFLEVAARGAIAVVAGGLLANREQGRKLPSQKENLDAENKKETDLEEKVSPEAKTLQPETPEKALPAPRFLEEEIELAISSLDNPTKILVRDELARIVKQEKQKLSFRRFNNSEKQKEKYLKPLLEQWEEIEQVVNRVDPEEKIPRPVVWGLLAMEGGVRGDINAVSGAAGPFQFTSGTAVALGLKEGERFNMDKAAEKALRYLESLRARFGNQWGLALTAYSGGPTKLERRIRDSFKLKKEESLTEKLFREKNINAVTLYSKKFKRLGEYHSVQYPFGAQAMAEWLAESLSQSKKYEIADTRR